MSSSSQRAAKGNRGTHRLDRPPNRRLAPKPRRADGLVSGITADNPNPLLR